MAITIRELLASDTISQAADKINFNFDQLLLNGGGPQGPQGPQGPPGPIGGRGIRGSVWYEGTVPPTATFPTATPEDEDNYLQANGDVWTYDEAIPGWVNTTINLQGPVGPPGASGKFAEYQAIPYTAAGDTTIFPDEMSAAAYSPLNQGVRSVLIGGFPESPAFTPTSSGTTRIVPLSIAQNLEKNSYTLMLHQFDANDTALVFHGGDATSDFEQNAINELSFIKLELDDALRIVSPKARTGSNATPGVYIEATKRGIDLNAGRELTIRTGTTAVPDNYAGQDNFLVQVAQSAGNSAEPYASISTVVSGQEAELRIGETSPPVTTTTNPGNLVGLAGKISLIGSAAMNLRTTTDITIDAGTSITIDAATNIDIDAGTSITVDASTFIDIDAITDIDINAGSTIDMIGDGQVKVQSTNNNLSLWAIGATSVADLYANQDVTVHAKTGDVHIYTESAGDDVLIDTSNVGSQIKLETTGNTAPIYIRTGSTASPISLQTFAASDISLNSGDDIIMNAADVIVLNATSTLGTIDMNADMIDMDAATSISMRSPEITITSEGGPGEITLTKNSSTAVVNIRPTSASAGSYLNVYSNNPATDGIRVAAFGSNYITIDALGATDKLIIQGWSGIGTAPGYDSGLEIKATNDIDGHASQIGGVDPNVDIMRSGTYHSSNSEWTDGWVIHWMRVGNVVTGSGIAKNYSGTPVIGFPTVPAPIYGDAGTSIEAWGTWVHNSVAYGNISTSSNTRILFTNSSFGVGDFITFTFSYRIF